MSEGKGQLQGARAGAWLLGLAGTFLILGGLSWLIVARTTPPGLDEARMAERKAFLAEVRAADRAALTTAAVVDAQKGIYRIPIKNAMNLLLTKWQDPAAGRADLLQRLEAATAKPPEPVSEYE